MPGFACRFRAQMNRHTVMWSSLAATKVAIFATEDQPGRVTDATAGLERDYIRESQRFVSMVAPRYDRHR
jgi:hypothetical protein